MDFTPSTYHLLLDTLQGAGYHFITFEEYCSMPPEQLAQIRYVILRHDVDDKPKNSLRFAYIENQLHIRASYYFRILPKSNQPEIIQEIADLGHEIGYHYEDPSLTNGDMELAIQSFQTNLEYFRRYYPVRTICMHGAPTSRFDGRDMWKKYDYHRFGIIGEPYFDMDFDHALYLTDTGRCWDGYRFSVRDKVPQQEKWNQEGLTFHTTQSVIRWLHQGSLNLHPLPNLMITTHPQRWNRMPWSWLVELLVQSVKNMIKSYIIHHRK